MEDYQVEQIFAIGIEVGVINLAKQLGMIDELVTEKQAFNMYGSRQVKEWRSKRWIVGYPSGNKTLRKFNYRRSELETASRMLDLQNILPATRIDQIIENYRTGKLKAKADREALKEIRKRLNS